MSYLERDEGVFVREFSLGEAGATAFAADAKQLLRSIPGGFRLWDVPTGKSIKDQRVDDSPLRRLGISPNGKRAFFIYHKKELSLGLLLLGRGKRKANQGEATGRLGR